MHCRPRSSMPQSLTNSASSESGPTAGDREEGLAELPSRRFHCTWRDGNGKHGLGELGLECRWCHPGLGAVQHAVAIGADEGQVGQPRGGCAGCSQWQDVVRFNETCPQVPVSACKVESADLARKGAVGLVYRVLLPLHEGRASLPPPMQSGKEATFVCLELFLVGLGHARQQRCGGSVADRLYNMP